MRVPTNVIEKCEHYFEIPEETLEKLDWLKGDEITWTVNNDGSYSLTKSN